MSGVIRSSCYVPTERAPRYLGQLCKHFAHKVPSTHSDDRTEGHVQFPFGECRLTADADGLHIRIESRSAENMARARYVVTDHVKRFAFREKPEIEWSEATVS